MQRLLIIIILCFSVFAGTTTFAQEPESTDSSYEEVFHSEYFSGKVIDILYEDTPPLRYLTELKNGEVIELDSYGEPLHIGDKVYVEYFINQDNYNFITVHRNTPLFLLLGLFVITILFLSRKKGVRSLISLTLSFFLLFFVLVPLIIQGFNPLWVTLLFGLAILFLSIFITHGFNYQSLVSFLSSFGAILFSLIILLLVMESVTLTGFIDDYMQYLNFETQETLNLVRIVSASIIIGILGVLDDITITQVSVVRELSTNHLLSRVQIFRKALSVGRDHIASLVNTLVFAYVGAALPLVLFVSLIDIPWWVLISQEFMFVEIVRSLVGVLALILAVPLATWLAVYFFLPLIHRDACTVEAPCGHAHHHS